MPLYLKNIPNYQTIQNCICKLPRTSSMHAPFQTRSPVGAQSTGESSSKTPLSHDAYLPEPLTFIQLSYTLRRHLRLKGNQFSKMIRHSRLVRKYPCSCTLSLLLIQKLDETLDRRTSFQHVISRTSKLQNAVHHPPLTRGVTSQQVS